MNQKPFLFALIHFYITLFSLLTTITFSSVDPKFEACEPKTCGNGQNISYPFYIKGKQPPFCGYPRFELTCSNNGFPILTTLSNAQYIVNKIFYNNQSLRVSIPEFSQPSTTCIPLIHTFSRYSRRFSVAPKQKEVILFYGCDLSSLPEEIKDQRIGCSAENKTRSVVALYREDPNLSTFALRSCKGGVANTTVEDEISGGGIEDALRRGFLLNWTASNCYECMKSGGRCGFDPNPDTYAFRCYCRDGVHFAKCDDNNPQPQSPQSLPLPG